MLERLFQEPTINYCEQPIDFIIRRPYYFLSNFSFFIVAFIIFSKKNKLSTFFGTLAVILGICSSLYDATFFYAFQLLDLAGMLVFINTLLLLNSNQFIKLKQNVKILIHSFLVIFSLLVIYLLQGFSGNIIFGLFIALLLLSEYILFKRGLHKKYSNWKIGFILFLLGFIIWLFDATHTICFDFGLLNGRAIFHYLNSVSIYFLYKFYSEQTLLKKN